MVLSKEGYQTKTISYEVHANETTEIGNIVLETLKFAGGDGSEENPYQVSTPEQLNAVRENLNAHYIQINDIDLSVYENWEPIGGYGISNYDENNTFKGTYDGNDFKILNLTIKNDSDLATIGLFGSSNGLIENMIIENVNIVVDTSHINFNELDSANMINIGSVVGVNGGNISNILSNGYIEVNGTIDMNMGGIVGTGGIITNSINYIDLNVYTQPNEMNGTYSSTIGFNCGGISGCSEEIDSCINYGEINASTEAYLNCGGINGEDAKISKCVNYGFISGKVTANIIYGSMGADGNCNIGGIVGTMDMVNLLLRVLQERLDILIMVIFKIVITCVILSKVIHMKALLRRDLQLYMMIVIGYASGAKKNVLTCIQ